MTADKSSSSTSAYRSNAKILVEVELHPIGKKTPHVAEMVLTRYPHISCCDLSLRQVVSLMARNDELRESKALEAEAAEAHRVSGLASRVRKSFNNELLRFGGEDWAEKWKNRTHNYAPFSQGYIYALLNMKADILATIDAEATTTTTTKEME